MAAKFKKIVINSAKELKAIIERYNDTSDFQDAVRYVQAPTPEDQLGAWLDDIWGLSLCEDGRAKILKSAGKVNSWKEYFRKHWDDDDGVREWFRVECDHLVGRAPLELYDDGGWLSFNAILRKNKGLKWAKWPFKKVTK